MLQLATCILYCYQTWHCAIYCGLKCSRACIEHSVEFYRGQCAVIHCVCCIIYFGVWMYRYISAKVSSFWVLVNLLSLKVELVDVDDESPRSRLSLQLCTFVSKSDEGVICCSFAALYRNLHWIESSREPRCKTTGNNWLNT
jgi:hypothetical protein